MVNREQLLIYEDTINKNIGIPILINDTSNDGTLCKLITSCSKCDKRLKYDTHRIPPIYVLELECPMCENKKRMGFINIYTN